MDVPQTTGTTTRCAWGLASHGALLLLSVWLAAAAGGQAVTQALMLRSASFALWPQGSCHFKVRQTAACALQKKVWCSR